MDIQTQQKKLSALQYALSMVGVTTNLLTVDIILNVITQVEEKGEKFCLEDAALIIDSAHKKYGVPAPGTPQPQGQVRPMTPAPKPIVEDIIEEEPMIDTPESAQ
jgi:hypothetical protein